MSTRCQVILKDEYGDSLWFYRHSDGYPEGVMPSLNRFMDLVKSNKIRGNVTQAAGWLVLIGAEEYEVSLDSHSDWKCGAYEPCPDKVPHGGIEYLYILHLGEQTITTRKIDYEDKF